jgi:hypothetical protein
MAKERVTITIDQRVVNVLSAHMKKHHRNRSNAVELLLIKALKIPKKLLK